MRKKNKIVLFIFSFLIIMILASCTGSKGDTGSQGLQGVQGEKGEDGKGIVSISKTSTEGFTDIYLILYTDGTTSFFTVTNGEQGIQGIQGNPGDDGHTPVITIGANGNWFIDGADTTKPAQGLQGETGNGISNIEKTGSDDLTDTYTITFTNGNTTTFTVDNGSNGKSAYEIYLEYYPDYEGTEEEWLEEIIIRNTGCEVTFKNDGTIIDTKSVLEGNKVSKPENPTKEGYTFDGWYYQGEKWSFIGYIVTEDITLEAKWNINSYDLSLNKNIDEAGTISESGSFNYDETVTITATTNPGYTFEGWYEGTSLVTTDPSYTFDMPANNLSYTAKWSINQYTVTLDNQADGVTISGLISGNNYDFGTQINLTVTNNSYLSLEWAVNGNVVYHGSQYSFTVPDYDVNIVVTGTTYIRNEDKIYFGKYPQTRVIDDSLIQELNSIAGTTPTSTNLYNWTDYNYYISSYEESYMYYQDIDLDNDGLYDYRGVYFSKYRPYYTYYDSTTNYSLQDNNGYLINEIYWFSYDPIEWIILNEEDGKALIIANLLLDSQDFYPTQDTSTFSHNGGVGYVNNYELSNIRKFLNDDFYNSAFKGLNEEIIKETIVDNSVESTGKTSNNYVCNNTNDKIFLLSYSEVITYQEIFDSIETEGTDYAKCQGLEYYNFSATSGGVYWWTRSPSSNNANLSYRINVDSGYNYMNANAYYNGIGVRPACWINF